MYDGDIDEIMPLNNVFGDRFVDFCKWKYM